MQTREVTLIQLVADEGKTFARKEDGEILGKVLHLGLIDSPNNYLEVDEVSVEPETEDSEETQIDVNPPE